MGTGKTTWAINKIKEETDNKFIYITPYLDEIKRLKQETNDYNKMYEPFYEKSNKQNSFHRLLQDGKNICSTHALFRKSNDITRTALQANNYILILDEVMDVVEELIDFTQDDLDTIFNDKLAYVDDDYLLWHTDKKDYDGRYNDIKYMAMNRNLICINGKLLYWNFPVDIFKHFKEVWILTYMFGCQIQRYYYDFHNIKYEYYQVENSELIDYDINRDYERRKRLAKIVNIYQGNLNLIGEEDYSLCVNWFRKDDGTLQGILKNNLYNWFNNINRNIKAKYRLWTAFKASRNKLKGKGYTNQFIPVNARATNDYRNTYVLAYCCNRYVKPTLELFFNKRNIYIDQDKYALSEMLQWIWRSRIRKDENIIIYLPSKRMRNLLINYLYPQKDENIIAPVNE